MTDIEHSQSESSETPSLEGRAGVGSTPSLEGRAGEGWTHREEDRAPGESLAGTIDQRESPTEQPSIADRPAPFWAAGWFLPASMLILTLAVFARFLFGTQGVVVSAVGGDIDWQFAYFRKFGYDQLKLGHPALWNSHIFSGTPFVGNWQSALFYPPNWIYFVLPLDRALSAEPAISVFLVGLGAALWIRSRGLHPAAALLSGTIAMFCGPSVLNVYAGHLPSLDAIAWIPFLLLAVDHVIDIFGTNLHQANRAMPLLRYGLIGAVAIGMMLLSGHPQSAYNAAVTVTLYGIIRLIGVRRAWPAVFVLLGSAALALALAAPQLVAGFAATAEGTRSTGASYAFASTMAFPPENFLTVVMPHFFGDVSHVVYWGRWYFWEMSAFVGITALVLAVLGALRSFTATWADRADDIDHKRTFAPTGIWAGMVGILTIMALGSHTPLFDALYHYLPGFDRFRGTARFLNDAVFFLAALAGAGLDTLVNRHAKTKTIRAVGIACVTFAAVLVGVGEALHASAFGVEDGSNWEQFVRTIFVTSETLNQGAQINTSDFFTASQRLAGSSCLVCGATVALLAALLLLGIRRRRLAYGVLFLGLAEMLTFAVVDTPSFDMTSVHKPVLKAITDDDNSDYRILQIGMVGVDRVMDTPTSDLWGYDPTVLGRYAEFMTYTQGEPPDGATMYLQITHGDNMMRLFRLKHLIASIGGSARTFTVPAALPHAFLAKNCIASTDRDAIFDALGQPKYDLMGAVYVGAKAAPPITQGNAGTISAKEDYPGRLTITADVPGSALAVITDPYSRDWRAMGLTGSARRRYTVIPADYAAMAIPLTPGHHVIHLDYMPAYYERAIVVSRLAWCLAILLAVAATLPRRRLT